VMGQTYGDRGWDVMGQTHGDRVGRDTDKFLVPSSSLVQTINCQQLQESGTTDVVSSLFAESLQHHLTQRFSCRLVDLR